MTPQQLRDYRLERKLTIQEAARKLGYSEQAINDYEHGKVEIPRILEMIIKFNP